MTVHTIDHFPLSIFSILLTFFQFVVRYRYRIKNEDIVRVNSYDVP